MLLLYGKGTRHIYVRVLCYTRAGVCALVVYAIGVVHDAGDVVKHVHNATARIGAGVREGSASGLGVARQLARALDARQAARMFFS